MWDPSVFWRDGYYYAIMMYNPDFVPERDRVLDPKCGFLARSRDDVPHHDFETVGVERIGNKYVMLGGGRPASNGGYNVCVLIADRPKIPYYPDKEAYVLCGNSNKSTSSIVPWARGKDNEKLISDYAGTHSGVWMLPMRKPVFTGGHLRLGWWENNDILKRHVYRGNVAGKTERGRMRRGIRLRGDKLPRGVYRRDQLSGLLFDSYRLNTTFDFCQLPGTARD